MSKELTDVIDDVYNLFDPSVPHVADEDNLERFSKVMKDILRTRLAERTHGGDLRFSSLGKQDRQIWYAAHSDGSEEVMTSKTYFKFLYGDVIEALLLFLVREAGHSVEMEQAEIEVDGIKGHIDAIIDGTVVDVKSASSYGFKKFKENSILGDDPFGYVQQLAGYASVLTPGAPAAWLAMDKVSGALALTPLSSSVIKDHEPLGRIEHLKEVIARDEPPPRCYEPVDDGKSGNKKLNTPCSYCSHKFRCHPNLRTYLYGTGPRYLTTVVRPPDVPELVVGTSDIPEVTD